MTTASEARSPAPTAATAPTAPATPTTPAAATTAATTTAATGHELLAAYRPGADRAFLAGPTRTLLAEGLHRAVPDPAEAGRILAAARAEGRDAVVVGAIPFSPGRPAELFVPERVHVAAPVGEDVRAPAPGARTGETAWTRRPVPAPEGYRDAVARAVRLMDGPTDLAKVVLARTLELTAADGIDIPAMVARLLHRDPRGYTFAVPAGGTATLVGASPELLLSRRGTQVVSNPLAGSAARSDDPVEDRRRAEALTRSAKDLAEHAFVVDAVRRALAPHCTHLVAPERPSLLRTAAMWHLSTTVTGTLRDPRPARSTSRWPCTPPRRSAAPRPTAPAS